MNHSIKLQEGTSCMATWVSDFTTHTTAQEIYYFLHGLLEVLSFLNTRHLSESAMGQHSSVWLNVLVPTIELLQENPLSSM